MRLSTFSALRRDREQLYYTGILGRAQSKHLVLLNFAKVNGPDS
jgi:hypothetical protein